MLQHPIRVKNERRETHAEPRGVPLKIKNAYPWPNMISCLVKNNIQGYIYEKPGAKRTGSSYL
jgi:hypothetical protein